MNDILTGLFAQPPGADVNLSDFLLRLLVCALCGQSIGWFYARSHGSLSYSQNFVQALVVLSMVVAVIMGVVGDSLARAFGLAAALAIVRFRTPVKDARDTTYLFLSVAVGMAAGAGQLAIAGASTVVIGLMSMWLQWTAFGLRSQAEGLVRFRLAAGHDGRQDALTVLGRHCRTFELSAARELEREGGQELVYDVTLRGKQAAESLVAELSETAGVHGVSLLPNARSGEG